jgi:hypothetical protein
LIGFKSEALIPERRACGSFRPAEVSSTIAGPVSLRSPRIFFASS